MLRGTVLESILDAELVRLGPGERSPCRAIDAAGAVLVIVEGRGEVLSGDVWISVGPGDRVALDAGEDYAARSAGGPLSAVLLLLSKARPGIDLARTLAA